MDIYNSTEIDIRQEVEDLISGKDFGVEHSAVFVQRKLRRDPDMSPVKCVCFDPIANEGRQGCTDCDGIGYLWDEVLINGFMFFLTTKSLVSGFDYKNDAGRAEKHEVGFVTRYSDLIGKGDIVYSPILNESGGLLFPIVNEEEYVAINYKKYRLDRAKQEYNLTILKRIK